MRLLPKQAFCISCCSSRAMMFWSSKEVTAHCVHFYKYIHLKTCQGLCQLLGKLRNANILYRQKLLRSICNSVWDVVQFLPGLDSSLSLHQVNMFCGVRAFAQVKDLSVFNFRRVSCGNIPVLQTMCAHHFIPIFTVNFLSIRHKLMGKFCFPGGEFGIREISCFWEYLFLLNSQYLSNLTFSLFLNRQ